MNSKSTINPWEAFWKSFWNSWEVFFAFPDQANKRLENLLTSLLSKKAENIGCEEAFKIGRELNFREVNDNRLKKLDVKVDLVSKVQRVLQRDLSDEESSLLLRLSNILDITLNETLLESILSKFYSSSRDTLAKQLETAIGLSTVNDSNEWRKKSDPSNVIDLIATSINRSLREDEKARINCSLQDV